MSLSVICESLVLDTPAGEAPLSFTVSRSLDHGLPHGQHRLQTWSPASVRFLVMAQTTASGCDTDHGHPRGFWWSHRCQLSPLLQQAQGPRHGPWQQHLPQTPMVFSMATHTNISSQAKLATNTNLVPGGSPAHEHQHGFRQ